MNTMPDRKQRLFGASETFNCPYCGKESSFVGAYVTGGAMLGGGVYYLLHLNEPFVDRIGGMFLWIILGGLLGFSAGANAMSKIKRSMNDSEPKSSKFEKEISRKLSFIEEIRKKFSKWFIGIGVFLVALALFISWRRLAEGSDVIVMVASLIVIGVILICFGSV